MGTKILVTKPGGGKECGSALTPTAKKLLKNYKRIRQRIAKVADQEFKKIF
jgi:molybdate transport repressor ModE-like protein